MTDAVLEEIIKKNESSSNKGRILFEDFYEVMVKGYSWY